MWGSKPARAQGCWEVLAAQRGEALTPSLRALAAAGAIRPAAVYIRPEPALRGWLLDAFRGILGTARAGRLGGVIEVYGTREDLENLGLGFLIGRAHARTPAP